MKKFSPSLFEAVEPGARKAHKREILSCALACFNEMGIEATTIEAIRAKASSSVGSIYHHFGNKEGLVAALCFAALDDQLQLIKRHIESVTTPREAIAVLIKSYMAWVAEKPELARFLSQARNAVANGPFAKDLAARNKQRYGDLHKWLAKGIQDGDILELPKETYASLLIGPAENFCRAWLSGRVKQSPVACAEVFADAAWRSIASR
jgi:AcrR family transcriptional regulator